MISEPVHAQRLPALLSQARGVAIALLVAAGLAAIHLAADGHDQQRVVQLAFLAAAVAVMLAGGRALILPGAVPGAALLVFFALGLAAALRAPSPLHGLLEVALWWLLLAVALAGAGELARDDGPGRLLVLQLLGAGVALYCVKVLVVWGSALALHGETDLFSFAPGFSNYRFLNHGQTVTLPLLVLLCLEAPARQRRFWFALAALWWALLFLLGGRGTQAGLLAGSVVALLVAGRAAFPFCRAMLATAVAGALAWVLLFRAAPFVAGMAPFGTSTGQLARTLADPGSGRGALWHCAWDLIAAHPWLGAGPMHFAHLPATAASFAHPHNWMLQVGAEWGLPALAAVCVALLAASAALLRAGWQARKDMPPPRVALCAWIVTGCAILTDALVSGLVVMPVSQMAIVLYLACALGQLRAGGAPAGPRLDALFRVLTLLALLLAGAAAVLSYQSAGAEDERYIPRFWLQGHF